MKAQALLVLALVAPPLAFAQEPGSDNLQAPPLIDAAPPPVSTPGAGEAAATPPPPGLGPQGTMNRPAWSPYGPARQEAPPAEYGLMATETAFGMLTAAGSSLLLYYLGVKPMRQAAALGDPTMGQMADIIFLLGFASVPMAVAQTEVGLANGSRYYTSETWPAALSGLGAQAAVLGLHYLTFRTSPDGGEALLLIGTIGAVPLVEMVVINLTKTPRWKTAAPRVGAALTLDDGGTVQAGLPLPRPTLLSSGGGPRLGLQLPLLEGRF